MITFRIHPVPKPRMSHSDIWKKRPSVVRYFEFKDKILRLARISKFTLPDKYKVEFLIKMPAHWSKKKKMSMLGRPHQQTPDLDNLIKALNDCLKKEDKTVWSVDSAKLWWEEDKIIIY